jgi:hypothetical protein
VRACELPVGLGGDWMCPAIEHSPNAILIVGLWTANKGTMRDGSDVSPFNTQVYSRDGSRLNVEMWEGLFFDNYTLETE